MSALFASLDHTRISEPIKPPSVIQTGDHPMMHDLDCTVNKKVA